ncbi:hypothetical protein ACMFMG_005207 [Clarireedia jacksonii]
MRAILIMGTDEQVSIALKSLPVYLQVQSLRRLRSFRRRRRRQNVVDGYIEDIPNKEQSQLFQRMLPLGSRALVKKYLPSVVGAFEETAWVRLARYYPDIALVELEKWAERAEPNDPILLGVGDALISYWAYEKGPSDRALQALKIMMKKFSPSQLRLWDMEKMKADQLIPLLLDHDHAALRKMHFQATKTLKGLRKLSTERLIEISQVVRDIIDTLRFPQFTLEQRIALYPLIRETWRDDCGILPTNVVSSLPTNIRLEEARRHLALPALDSRTAQKCRYIAMLPWEEAMELQKPMLYNKDVSIRSVALGAQIWSAKFDQSHLSNALDLALRFKNDQDSTRLAIFNGLDSIPASRWKEQHLPQLSQLFRHYLDARDLSFRTQVRIVNFLRRVVTFHPAWTSQQLLQLFQERRAPQRNFLKYATGKYGPKQILSYIQTTFSSFIQTIGKKDISTLTILGIYFGTHIKYWPELLDIAEKWVRDDNSEELGVTGLGLLEKCRPQALFEIVPLLINRKEKTDVDRFCTQIRTRIIRDHILKYRQDLLPQILLDPKDSLEILYSIKNKTLLRKWTAEQQSIYARHLISFISNAAERDYSRPKCIDGLRYLSYTDPQPLIDLTFSKTPIIHDCAIKALAKFDTPAGHNTIINHLQSTNPSISKSAVYALPSIIKFLPPSSSLTVFKTIPLDRVTIAKETLCLIGSLQTDDAYAHLLSLSQQSNLHTDVYSHLLSALSYPIYMSKPSTWKLYNSITTAKDPYPKDELLQSLIDTITSIRPVLLKKYADTIFSVLKPLLTHPHRKIRIQVLQKLAAYPCINPPPTTLLQRIDLLFSALTSSSLSSAELRKEILNLFHRGEIHGHSAALEKLEAGLKKWVSNEAMEEEEVAELMTALLEPVETAVPIEAHRLALTLLTAAAKKWGWSEERKGVLEGFRRAEVGGGNGNGEVMIRELALGIVVPEEDDEEKSEQDSREALKE